MKFSHSIFKASFYNSMLRKRQSAAACTAAKLNPGSISRYPLRKQEKYPNLLY